MYERSYGLEERPFSLTWDPRYLLLTSAHEEALSTLQYGISHRMGIIVLVGGAGTGKTTVIRAVMSQTAGGCLVFVNNPLLTRNEFFQYLAQGFDLSEEAAASKTRFLSELAETLRRSLRNGSQTGLIVDEAHALPYEIFEEIRLLANIETDDEPALPIVLSGQLELDDRLSEPSLRSLKQRVALRCSLGSLQMEETARYVAERIRVAGGDGKELFTAEALELIHRCSRGVPRVISIICDNALVTGFALDECPISRKTVLEVCGDLNLEIPDAEADARPLMLALPAHVGRGDEMATARPDLVVNAGSRQLADRPTVGAGSFRRLFF